MGDFYIFFTNGRAGPGCKNFVKVVFYVELRIDRPPVSFTYRGCRETLRPDDFGGLASGAGSRLGAVPLKDRHHRSGEDLTLFPSQVRNSLFEVARVTVGACVQRARGKVEVRAVSVDLRLGLVYSLVLHFFGWVKVKGKGNLLAEVGKHFLARGEAEGRGGGNARLGVVTVGNGTVRANLGDALHAREAGVKVKVALLDLGFGGGVIHYVPENRRAAPCRKLFFVFFAESFVPTERKKCVNT